MSIVDEIAKQVVGDIFSCGTFREAERPHRIAFMGGNYPDAEVQLGGFCEDALVKFVAKSIAKAMLSGQARKEDAA